MTVPFSFEKDDAQYLTWEKRDAGFRSNTDTANSQPDKQNVAVRDYSHMIQTLEWKQLSTVKDNNFLLCFLQ